MLCSIFLLESESELESLHKELELESHGIDSLLESIPVAESIPPLESIPLKESIPPHRGSYSSVECGKKPTFYAGATLSL